MRDAIDDVPDRTSQSPEPIDKWADPAPDDTAAGVTDSACWSAWTDTGGEG
jgi:hypothetical protein